MTPERLEYEKERAAIQRQTAAARKELNDLIRGAEAFDLVLTIEQSPLWPPAMGNYETVGKVRISRERYRRLAELCKAAEKSEEVRDA